MIQSLRVMYTRVVHIPKGSLQIDIRNYRPRPNDTNYMGMHRLVSSIFENFNILEKEKRNFITNFSENL